MKGDKSNLLSWVDAMEPLKRSEQKNLVATVVIFLFATNGSDIIARVLIGQDSITAAAAKSVYYSVGQIIATLILFGPFIALALLTAKVWKRTNDFCAFIFFDVFVCALAYVYFMGFWRSHLALHRGALTDSALAIGFIPFRSVPIIFLAAITAYVIKWKWRNRESSDYQQTPANRSE